MVITCRAIDIIEAIAPVEAKQAEHRQIDTHAETCRTLHIERIEVLEPEPAVTGFEEGQGIDGGLWIQRERITQLQGVFREHVATLVGIVIGTRRQRVVGITTHTHQLAAVHGIAAQAIAAHEVTMEGRRPNLLVIVAQIAEAHAGHHHEFLIEFGVPYSLKGPAVHLDPFVFLVVRKVGVILIGEQRIGRCDFQSQLELGATARIEGLAYRVA